MLSISVTNARQNQQIDHRAGPFEFGRGPQGEVPRVVIDDGFVSRDQLRVEELPGGRIRVKNLSTKNPIVLPDGSEIPANESRDLPLPFGVTVGETSIGFAHKPEAAPPGMPGIAARPAAAPRPAGAPRPAAAPPPIPSLAA